MDSPPRLSGRMMADHIHTVRQGQNHYAIREGVNGVQDLESPVCTAATSGIVHSFATRIVAASAKVLS